MFFVGLGCLYFIKYIYIIYICAVMVLEFLSSIRYLEKYFYYILIIWVVLLQ